jgi:hypothetical protein
MKKILIALALSLALLIPGLALAAGTCTQSLVNEDYTGTTKPMGVDDVRIVKFVCTGDASDGTFPAISFVSGIVQKIQGLFLYKVNTVPGATNPTASWGVTVTNSDSLDLLGGAGAGRSASAAQAVIPLFFHPVSGSMTLNISSNSVASANITLYVFFVK